MQSPMLLLQLHKGQNPIFKIYILMFNTLPFHTGLDHVTGHQLQSGLQVFSKLFLWPVQISYEGLQSIQLPEQILRCARAITAGSRITKKDFKSKCFGRNFTYLQNNFCMPGLIAAICFHKTGPSSCLPVVMVTSL